MSSPAATPGTAMSPHRVRGLDGLRGFAALSVVLFHFRWRYAGGGYLTIDVFFALSGYLITNLLLAERAKHGRIRLLRFWSRRMVRLWPPVAVGLLLAAAFAKDLSPDHTTRGFWRDAMSAGGWAMDITTSLDPGHPRPLGYMWSLGIEEQFYLLWPLILVGAIAAGLRMRELSRLAASLSAGTFVIFVISWKNSTFLPAVYTRPDARSFAILLGCSVAICTADARWPGSRAHRVIAHPLAGLAALASVAAAFVLPGLIDPMLHLDPDLKIGAPLVALVTVALIAHVAARPTSPASRVLSIWPIAAIGTISYSLYLVHQPVVDTVYLHHFNDLPHTGNGLLLTQVGISFAAALVLWVLVERPARLLSQRIGPTVAPARRQPAHHPTRRRALVPLVGAVPIVLVLAGTSTAVVWNHRPATPAPHGPAAPPGAAPATHAPAPHPTSGVGGAQPAAERSPAPSPPGHRSAAPPPGRPAQPVHAPLSAAPSSPSAAGPIAVSIPALPAVPMARPSIPSIAPPALP